MEFLKEFLGDELYTQVADKLKDTEVKLADLSGGAYVARDKFERLNDEHEQTKGTLAELNETVKSYKDMDIDGVKKSAADWETKYNDLVEQTEAEKQQYRLDTALDNLLAEHKARNPKAVRALLNMDNIKLDGDTLLGVKEQLEPLLESDAYLFEQEEPKAKAPKWTGGVDTGGKSELTDEFAKRIAKYK